MAYILGFFSADGYLTHNKRGANFWSIQITDKELLECIRKVVGSEHKISEKIGKGNEKTLYRLQIGSKEMCKDLSKLGMFVRKTDSMSVPNVPAKYFSDFVRGYFDGDGNVWVGYLHKDRPKTTLSIQVALTSCSTNFLLELRRRLRLDMIIKRVISKGGSNFYRLVYSVKDSLKLYDFMYNHLIDQNSDIFLSRKRSVFERFIKMQS